MHIPEEFRLAAKKGAAFLDERRPGWFTAINPVTLDLGDLEYCVLGQVDGDFMEAAEILRLSAGDEVDLGFNLDERRPWDWVKLTKAWLREINDRRWSDVNTEAVNQ